MKKKILILLACLVAVAGVFCGIYWPNSEINNTISDVQNQLVEQIQNEEKAEKQNVIITDEVQEIVEETIEKVDNGEDISTTEVIESSEEEEKEITDEGALETDATVEQENISYDGSNTGNGLSLLGAYQGLTYYSQADSRWANVLYTSTGNSTQTMKSSACGPTSAAIIVSSSKGAILPTTMANLAVANGYRTANNGTAWAYFPFVADYFDFNEYYTTSSFYTAMDYLGQKNSNGSSKYFIVASCGSGLFTTGGHYITLVSLDGNTIQVYDPYLYSGKFNTASRRNAGVVVSGNSAFVSKDSFYTYANYSNFWIYSNDNGSGNSSKNDDNNSTQTSYIRYVATQSSNLNVRSSADINSSILTSLRKGTEVTVIETSGNWSKISSPVSGWVSISYLSSSAVTNTTTTTTTGMPSTGTVKVKTSLNVRTGPGTNYRYVKSLYNGNTVYIYESKNGWYRIGTNLWVCGTYINTSSSTSGNYTTSVGSYYTLKSNTILYSNGNLSGTTYYYLSKTRLKVISHYSNTVDYIYIPKTGRYAYCKVNAFK